MKYTDFLDIPTPDKKTLKKLEIDCYIGKEGELVSFEPLRPTIFRNARITEIRKTGILWWRKIIATIEFDEMENE